MNTYATITTVNYNHKNTYGGYINQYDFCTDYEGTRNIADRIVQDWSFDDQCRRNIINRNRNR